MFFFKRRYLVMSISYWYSSYMTKTVCLVFNFCSVVIVLSYKAIIQKVQQKFCTIIGSDDLFQFCFTQPLVICVSVWWFFNFFNSILQVSDFFFQSKWYNTSVNNFAIRHLVFIDLYFLWHQTVHRSLN